jgi:hypothetical protein
VVRPLTSKDEIESYLKEAQPAVIGFFADSTNDGSIGISFVFLNLLYHFIWSLMAFELF